MINSGQNRSINRFSVNGSGGGVRPSFRASLQISTTPSLANGSPTPTFTRATTAYIFGYASGAVIADGPTWIACASGEARFWGARRIAQDSWSLVDANGVALTSTNGASSSCCDTNGPFGYFAEGARTNLVLQSSDFTASWAAVGTPTNSAGDSTGGVATQVIGDDSAAALEGYTQTITYTGNAVKAVSIVVKKGTSTSAVIRLRDTTAGADRLLAAVTWSGTTPVVTMTTGTDQTGTPVQLGTSGKYRLMFQTTSVTAANTNSLQVYPATDAALSVGNTGTTECGGVQSEDATFSSSVIPTTTGTVARNADNLTYPTAGNFNDANGSAYAEIQSVNFTGGRVNTARVLAVSANGNPLYMADDATGVAGIQDGSTIANVGAASVTAVNKVASKWITGGAMNAYAAGVMDSQGRSYDGSMTPGANMSVGYRITTTGEIYGCVRNVRLYTRALSDGQLQAMTT